ncbi:unnamed protein product [Arctogadus glacialis]
MDVRADGRDGASRVSQPITETYGEATVFPPTLKGPVPTPSHRLRGDAAEGSPLQAPPPQKTDPLREGTWRHLDSPHPRILRLTACTHPTSRDPRFGATSPRARVAVAPPFHQSLLFPTLRPAGTHKTSLLPAPRSNGLLLESGWLSKRTLHSFIPANPDRIASSHDPTERASSNPHPCAANFYSDLDLLIRRPA